MVRCAESIRRTAGGKSSFDTKEALSAPVSLLSLPLSLQFGKTTKIDEDEDCFEGL
jgi:hypothetical protein